MSKRITLRDLTLEFVVGLFFFVALALLAYFTMILNRENLIGSKDTLRMTFPEVAGLAEGDAVLARGVQIGAISSLSLEKDGVSVTATISRPIDIHEGYSLDIQFSSILGGRFIAIDPGPQKAQVLANDAVLVGNAPANLLADASEMIRKLSVELAHLRTSLDEGGTLENISEFTKNLNVISADIRDGKGTLGKLVNDPELYEHARQAATELARASKTLQEAGSVVNEVLADVRAGKGTLGKLIADDELYANANSVVANLKNGEGTLGRLLVDETIYTDLQTVNANLREITEKIKHEDSSVGKLLTDDGALFNKLLDTLETTSEITRRVRDGEGTLGKLVADESLYQEAKRVFVEVRSAVEDLREQAPIATFGSFIFGAL